MRRSNCQTRSTDYFKTQQIKTMSITPKSYISRAYILIKYGDTRLLEIFVGLFSLVWGLYILFPIDSFATTTVFVYLSKIIPEWVLGLSLAFVGMCTATFATSDSCGKRRFSLFLNHLAWMFVFMFAVTGHYASPAICTYGFFAATLMYLFLKSPSSRK